ncbi:MAG: ferritin-like domain-containing protein [Rhodospirillaceae bacterium]
MTFTQPQPQTIPQPSPLHWAKTILETPDPKDKARLTLEATAPGAWDGHLPDRDSARQIALTLPTRPARLDRPELRPPRDMPKRSTGPKGLIALLHALAHIELTAIDLAWDILARFPDQALDLGPAFFSDWLAVARDEAIHFTLLTERLEALDSAYGALPAHDGLWKTAETTSHDLVARLVAVPMVHEARGLDTTPGALDRLRQAKADPDVIAVLERIAADEVSHVAAGVRWFIALADQSGLDPEALFEAKVLETRPGGPKPPFNVAARAEAGMPERWYHRAADSLEKSRAS